MAQSIVDISKLKDRDSANAIDFLADYIEDLSPGGALAATRVGFGSPANGLTGITTFVFDSANHMLAMGSRTTEDGADPGFLLRRVITDSTGGGAGTTAHGFVDVSSFNRTGTTAYASFDDHTDRLGVDYDHHVSFQARPGFSITGTINSIRLFDSRPTSTGTADALNIVHFFASGDDEWLGTISGTQYGLYVEAMTLAATNWAIFVEENKSNLAGLILTETGRINGVNGSLGNASLYFGSNNHISGIFHASATAYAAQFEGVEKWRVQADGARLWDNSGLDCQLDIRGYRSNSWSANVITNAVWSSANGGEITFTTTTPHSVAVGQQVVISGFTPSAYNGTYAAATGTTGSTLVVAKFANPGTDTVLGQLDAKAETFGNSILTLAAPSSATAAGSTVANRAFAVLPATSGSTAVDFVIGVAIAGNSSLDAAAGTIKGASDFYTTHDSDGWLSFGRQSSTELARISVASASFINWDTNAAHRFTLENVNAGTGAFTEFELSNAATVNDRLGLRLLGTGFTTSGFFVQDTGVLYTGSNVSGGLNIGTLAGNISLYPGGGTQLGAVLTNNTRPSFVIGNAALTTTATDGFLYIPTCAGAPSGVPTGFTGRVAIVFDNTNNTICVYDGAWLTSAALT